MEPYGTHCTLWNPMGLIVHYGTLWESVYTMEPYGYSVYTMEPYGDSVYTMEPYGLIVSLWNPMGLSVHYGTLWDSVYTMAQLFDTGGEERHRSLTHNYYRGIDGVLLTYSVDDQCTLMNLQQWIESVEEVNSGDDIEKITWGIIGNKCDPQIRAKEGMNVVESFETVVREIHQRHHGSKLKQDVVDLEKVPHKREGKKDCYQSNLCCMSGEKEDVLLSDTAGVERYQRTLTNNYFRQADGAILMYDVADLVSFESLQDWIELTQKTLDVGMPEKFVWCLVGNQKDRGSKVDHVRAQSRCEDLRTTLNFLTCALKETWADDPAVTRTSLRVIGFSSDVTVRSKAAGFPRSQFETRTSTGRHAQTTSYFHLTTNTSLPARLKPPFNRGLAFIIVKVEVKTGRWFLLTAKKQQGEENDLHHHVHFPFYSGLMQAKVCLMKDSKILSGTNPSHNFRSVADSNTFENLTEWIELAKRYVEHYKSERFVWCFVCNKTDQERSVSIDRVQYSCQQLNTSLNFTTCARNGTNVMDALKATVASVHSMWIDISVVRRHGEALLRGGPKRARADRVETCWQTYEIYQVERSVSPSLYNIVERSVSPSLYNIVERSVSPSLYNTVERSVSPSLYNIVERSVSPSLYNIVERSVSPSLYNIVERSVSPSLYNIVERSVSPSLYNIVERSVSPSLYNTVERSVSPSLYNIVERSVSPSLYNIVERSVSPSLYNIVERSVSPSLYNTVERSVSPSLYNIVERSVSPSLYNIVERSVSPSLYYIVERSVSPSLYNTVERSVSPSLYYIVERSVSPSLYNIVERSVSPSLYNIVERSVSPSLYNIVERSVSPSLYYIVERSVSPSLYYIVERSISPSLYYIVERSVSPSLYYIVERSVSPSLYYIVVTASELVTQCMERTAIYLVMVVGVALVVGVAFHQ
eukprot:Em0018g699a